MDPQVAAALAARQQQISQPSPMSQPSTPTSLDNFQEEETSSNSSVAGSNDSSTDEPRCRFCLESSETTSSLIRPCRCDGSSGFVHFHCLQKWFSTRGDTKCAICNSDYLGLAMKVKNPSICQYLRSDPMIVPKIFTIIFFFVVVLFMQLALHINTLLSAAFPQVVPWIYSIILLWGNRFFFIVTITVMFMSIFGLIDDFRKYSTRYKKIALKSFHPSIAKGYKGPKVELQPIVVPIIPPVAVPNAAV